MPKYKCLNIECTIYNKIKGRNSRGYYNKELDKIIDTGEPCPECGKSCELQLPDRWSTNLKNFA